MMRFGARGDFGTWTNPVYERARCCIRARQKLAHRVSGHLTAKRWQESRVMRTEIPQGETGYGGQPDSQGPRRDRVGRHAALPERLQHVGVAQEGRPLVARVGGSVPLRGLTPYAMMS